MKRILITFALCFSFQSTTFGLSTSICPTPNDLASINGVISQSLLNESTSLVLVSNTLSTTDDGFTYYWEVYGTTPISQEPVSTRNIQNIGPVYVMTDKPPYNIKGAYTCHYKSDRSNYAEIFVVNSGIVGKQNQYLNPPGLTPYYPFYFFL